MNPKTKRAFLTLLTVVPALLPAAEEAPLLNQLPQNAIQSAFQVLRRDYIRREDLSYEELNRAALQGLLERLDFGADVVSREAKKEAAEPYVHSEFLAADTAYLRPESFSEGEGALFEKALTDVVEKKAQHLILDLRTDAGGFFEEAALMMQCFVPQGEMMFKMKQLNSDEAELFISKRSPLWEGRVVLLVDAETKGAAETLAVCLQARGRALVLGAKTRGATVRYTQVQLDDKTALRYASAEALLPDGASFFKKGLTPHFSVPADTAEKHKVFSGSKGHTLTAFIRDRVRPRFNERALVAGGNPELDDYVRRSKGQSLPGDEGQVRDVVTQRALDLLHSDDFYQQAKIDWKVKAEDLAPPPEEDIPRALPALPAQPAQPAPPAPAPASTSAPAPSPAPTKP